jgi:hypothetical protein
MIFAICLHNNCKREENGDACVASLAEKIITISIYKSLRVKTGQYPAFRRDPSVREDWTNQGRALRRLGEPNAGRAYGSHRPAAVPQSALRGGSSQSHDLLRAFRVVYRSGIPVRPATFGTLHFPSILSGLRPNDATKFFNVLHESGSDLVAHKPCGFIRTEAHVAADLQSAHSLLTGEHQADDLKPITKRLVRVLEYRAREMREAIGRMGGAALIALPVPRIALQLSNRLCSATAWTMDALWPTLSNQIGATGFLIRKRLIELCRRQLVDVFFGGHDRLSHPIGETYYG